MASRAFCKCMSIHTPLANRRLDLHQISPFSAPDVPSAYFSCLPASLMGKRHRPAKAHQSQVQENAADGADGEKFGPDDIQACAAIENRLGEGDKMGRG